MHFMVNVSGLSNVEQLMCLLAVRVMFSETARHRHGTYSGSPAVVVELEQRVASAAKPCMELRHARDSFSLAPTLPAVAVSRTWSIQFHCTRLLGMSSPACLPPMGTGRGRARRFAAHAATCGRLASSLPSPALSLSPFPCPSPMAPRLTRAR